MEEQQQAVDGVLESPIESEATAGKEQVDLVKPVQVRLIDYPPGFSNHQLTLGHKFQVNGEVFEVYNVLPKKGGRPRYMVRGIGILGIVEHEDPALQAGTQSEP